MKMVSTELNDYVHLSDRVIWYSFPIYAGLEIMRNTLTESSHRITENQGIDHLRVGISYDRWMTSLSDLSKVSANMTSCTGESFSGNKGGAGIGVGGERRGRPCANQMSRLGKEEPSSLYIQEQIKDGGEGGGGGGGEGEGGRRRVGGGGGEGRGGGIGGDGDLVPLGHQDSGRSSLPSSTSTSRLNGGSGGSGPPEDRQQQGRHLREGSTEDEAAEDEAAEDEAAEDEAAEEDDSVITCVVCNSTIINWIYFTATNANTCVGQAVCCSEACAHQKKSEEEIIVKVLLLNDSTIRGCSVCYEYKVIPFVVCDKCHRYICGKCFNSMIKLHERREWRCPYNCDNSSCQHLIPPDSIALPAKMKLIQTETAGVHSEARMTPQEIAHRRHQLEEEDRRLEEMNLLQDLFRPQAQEVSGSMVANQQSQDHGQHQFDEIYHDDFNPGPTTEILAPMGQELSSGVRIPVFPFVLYPEDEINPNSRPAPDYLSDDGSLENVVNPELRRPPVGPYEPPSQDNIELQDEDETNMDESSEVIIMSDNTASQSTFG